MHKYHRDKQPPARYPEREWCQFSGLRLPDGQVTAGTYTVVLLRRHGMNGDAVRARILGSAHDWTLPKHTRMSVKEFIEGQFSTKVLDWSTEGGFQ